MESTATTAPSNGTKPIPRRHREEDLSAIADALGVRDTGTNTLRAPCPHPKHPGDGDPNMRLYAHDDGVLGAVCGSHSCPPDEILAALRELIGDEPKGEGQPRQRREPASLPGDEQMAEWVNVMRRGDDDLIPGRLTALLRAAGWADHHEALADLGIGFDGNQIVIPVDNEAHEAINIVSYRPGAPRDRKNRGLTGRSKGLVPSPESIADPSVIYAFEGEPDGVTAKLAGLPATSYPGVDGWRPEYAERFRRFGRVVIVPDCDQPGREAAERIRASLAEHGVNATIIDLQPARTDGFDFKDLVKTGHRDVALAHAAQRVRELADGPIIDGAELLDLVTAALMRYVRFVNDEQVWTVTLWIVASHAFALDCFDTAPYLAVTSAERRSGKTRLIESWPNWFTTAGGSPRRRRSPRSFA